MDNLNNYVDVCTVNLVQFIIQTIIAHMIYYRLQRRVTSDDYADFLRRARRKAYQKTRRQDKVGDYLCIL